MRIIILILLLLLNNFSYAFRISHSDTKYWKLKTDHFIIFYESEKQKLAKYIATLAEDAYFYQKNIFKISLKHPVPIIIKSFDEYSFGDADPFSDRIIINEFFNYYNNSSMSPPYKELISHELAHIFTFRLLSKNIIFYKRLISIGLLPLWLIEGIAQFVGEEWNDYNEAYIRNIAKNNLFLKLEDLKSFYYFDNYKRHRGYLESFAFTKYLFQIRRKHPDLNLFLKEYVKNPFNIENTFLKLFKKTSYQLYEEYINYYRNLFKSNNNNNLNPLVKIENLRHQSFVKFSKNADKLYFIGDTSTTGHKKNYIFEHNLKTKKIKPIIKNADIFFDISPDNNYITYSHLYFSKKKHGYVHDIYIYNLKTKKHKRLTNNLSARFPCFLNTHEIAFTTFNSFGSGIYKINIKNGKINCIVKQGKGFYFFDLISYKGELFASAFDGESRQIVKITEKEKIIPITNFSGDNKNTRFFNDEIMFISSLDSRYNIYIKKNKIDSDISELYFKDYVLFKIKNLNMDITSFDIKNNLLAVSYISGSTEKIAVFNIKSLKTQNITPKLSFEKRKSPIIKIDGISTKYRRKMSFPIITPWYEYDEEGRIGILAILTDFLQLNYLAGKIFYNLESKRIGEKVTFITRNLPFDTKIEYENNVYQSSYGTSNYIKRIENISSQFEFTLNPKEKIYWGSEFQNISTVKLDPLISPLPFNGKINTLKFGYKFFKSEPTPDWDVNLQNGRYLKIEIKRADKLIDSDVEYWEYRFRWDEFIPVFKQPQNILIRNAFGYKKNITNLNSPILYGIGGVNTVRGFPNDTYFGTKYALLNLEYRFPIKNNILKPKIGYFYMNKLFGALFFDTGNAWYKGQLEFDDFISSLGVELKLKTLLVGKIPIITKLGFAQPIKNKKLGNSGSYITFTIPIF